MPFTYGAARALFESSLFSPIFRVEEEGWNGSGAAKTETFCNESASSATGWYNADLLALLAHHRRPQKLAFDRSLTDHRAETCFLPPRMGPESYRRDTPDEAAV